MASLVQNNNEHSLTSPEQKCTGEFGALAGDKSPSLPGTTNRGLWKVYSGSCLSLPLRLLTWDVWGEAEARRPSKIRNLPFWEPFLTYGYCEATV
jgi:hypothetical protein